MTRQGPSPSSSWDSTEYDGIIPHSRDKTLHTFVSTTTGPRKSKLYPPSHPPGTCPYPPTRGRRVTDVLLM